MRQTVVIPILALLVSGCAALTARPIDAPLASVDRGRFFVLRSCAGCHSVGELGASPNNHAPPFSTVRMRFDEPGLRRRLAEISSWGHVEMPPVAMTPDEIRDIAAYIETVNPHPIDDQVEHRDAREAAALANGSDTYDKT